MPESSQPTILELEGFEIDSARHTSNLALVVHPDREILPLLSEVQPGQEFKNKQLDLQAIDFLGPDEIFKQLFCLPYTERDPTFALHKIGNALLVDSVTGFDVNFYDEEKSAAAKHQGYNQSDQDIDGSERTQFENDGDKMSTKLLQNDPNPEGSGTEEHIVTERDTNSNVGDEHQLVLSLPDQPLQAGSPFLPPPYYFMPSLLKPANQVISWTLHEMRFAVGSDLNIYNSTEHPAFTLKAIDTTKELELSTCMDMYLDNVIANVPELALALHSKGFIRGFRFMHTNDIPYMTSSSIGSMSSGVGMHGVPVGARGIKYEAQAMGVALPALLTATGGPGPSGAFGSGKALDTAMVTAQSKFIRQGQAVAVKGGVVGGQGTGHCSGGGGGSDDGGLSPEPMFDPKVIDIDASAIMRFLREHCRRDDGTYILKRSPDGRALHLYDLGHAPEAKQKRFKWMLAMLSYRFAIRLGQHYQLATAAGKIQIRHRQMHLFQSCIDLLGEIKALGGEDHATIRASVLEQMADIHLARVDNFNARNRSDGSKHVSGRDRGDPEGPTSDTMGDKRGGTSSGNNNSSLGAGRVTGPGTGAQEHVSVSEDDDDYNERAVLAEATGLLCKAVVCIEDLIRQEVEARDREGEGEGARTSRSNPTSPLPSPSHSSVPRSFTFDPEATPPPAPADAEKQQGFSTSFDSADIGIATDWLDDDDGGENDDTIVTSLATQLAGVMHKLIQTSLVMAVGSLKGAKISEGINILCSLIPSCKLWATLKNKLLQRYIIRINRIRKPVPPAPSCIPSPLPSPSRSAITTTTFAAKDRDPPGRGEGEDEDGDMDALWGADMTIIQCLPLLWDLLGETTREIAKHTSGVSLHNSRIRAQLCDLVRAWTCLSDTVLGNITPTSPAPASASNATASTEPSLTTAAGGAGSETSQQVAEDDVKEGGVEEKEGGVEDNEPDHEAVPAGISGAKSKNKIKAKKVKAKRAAAAAAASMERAKNEKRRLAVLANWSMLTAPLQPLALPSHKAMAEFWGKAGDLDDLNDVLLRVLGAIHALVAPVVLQSDEFVEEDGFRQLSNAGEWAEGGHQGTSGKGRPGRVVVAISEELYVTILMAYCFLCATLLHHNKAVGGRGHRPSPPAVRGGAGEMYNSQGQRGPEGDTSSRKQSQRQRAGGGGGRRGAGGTARPGVPRLRTDDARVREGLRRFGDACNAMGQHLLQSCNALMQEERENWSLAAQEKGGATDTAGARGDDDGRDLEIAFLLEVATKVFFSSVVAFSCAGDSSNSAAVRCNMSALARTKANWRMAAAQRVDKMHKANATTSKINKTNMINAMDVGTEPAPPLEAPVSGAGSDGSVNANANGNMGDSCLSPFDVAMECVGELRLALKHCDKARAELGGARGAGTRATVWDAVVQEEGQLCLSIGIISRNSLVLTGSDEHMKGKTYQALHNSIVLPLRSALEIFSQMGITRQSAAAHFHLGAFFSSSWSAAPEVDPSEASVRLEQAMTHYQEAHKYYSKFDVGPTLVLILQDMCDLYLASYAASEARLKDIAVSRQAADALAAALINGEIAATPVGKVDVVASATAVSSAADGVTESNSTWVPPVGADVVDALLGGALQALLECRCAFTRSVVERHGDQMRQLAQHVSDRMCKILLKIFAAQARGYLPPDPPRARPPETDTTAIATTEREVASGVGSSGVESQSLKATYGRLLKLSSSVAPSTNSSSSTSTNSTRSDVDITVELYNVLDALRSHDDFARMFSHH